MTAAATRSVHQRSSGQLMLWTEAGGLARFREMGAAKARFPKGGREAILINTGGGLAGGDDFEYNIGVGRGAKLSVTTQGAERVYRSLGPPARVRTRLEAKEGATLHWLPQETILFDNSALVRSFDVQLAGSANFLAVETIVFGRREMGERISSLEFRDSWRIRRDGSLLHADDIAFGGALPNSSATLDGAGAMAFMIYVSADAERALDGVRAAIENGGASAWNGKLVARVLARDGFELRKSVTLAIQAIAGDMGLPKAWTL